MTRTMQKNLYLSRRLAIALLSAMAILPQGIQAQDFTPDLFPGQSPHRTELEVSATVNVGDFGQATNMKSWVQNLTSTNQNVVQTYNQNGYTAVLIVGVGEADVTYTETMFNGDDAGGGASGGGVDGGGGAEGGTSVGVTTNHTIHYTVIKGAPTAQYTLEREPVTSARLFWDGENPYAFTFTPPSLEIIIKEVYLEQNMFPKFRDTYISPMQCQIESTNPNVASASMRGITPVSFGKTTIRATWQGNENWVGASAEYELSVEAPKQTIYIAFAQREVTGFVGESMTAPQNMQMQPIDHWVSENPNVATVDEKTGTVTFVSEGTTRILAQVDETDEHYAAQGYYTVNVKKRNHEMSFSETEVNVELGVPFTPPTLNNPHNLQIEKWYCDNYEVADVNESTGEVTIKKTGTVTVTCETFGNDTYAAGTASYTIYVTTIGIKVMGVSVTSLNCGDILGDGQKQATFDKSTYTLTLNEFHIQAQTLSYDIQKAVIVNESPHTLQIRLVGTSSIMNAVECIVSDKAPVVIMSDDKSNSLALIATTAAIRTNALKVYDSHLYASSNAVALKLGDMLSVYKGGYVLAETESTTLSAIECKNLERGMDNSGGIEILTPDVVFMKGMGFFTGEHKKDPVKRIEIGKVPIIPSTEEETTIEFKATDPEDNDAVVFSTSGKDTYNEETGQLEISTSLTDEQVAEALETLIPGSSAWIECLPGSLVFDVPAGKGEIKVNCFTLPGYTLNIMIEGKGAVSISKAEPGWARVSYDVAVPTHVVIYLHAASSTSAQPAAMARKAPSSDANAYISAVQITPEGVPDGINDVPSAAKADNLSSKNWYDVSGRRVAQPTKGLYIVNGKKVVTK